MFDKPPHETDITEWLNHKILGGQLAYEILSKSLKASFSEAFSCETIWPGPYG